MYSRRKPTPKIPPTAICVELTGRPNLEAMITVMAAATATQNERILSSSVISVPTVRISFGPYRARPIAIPRAPTIITHTGIAALADTPPCNTASLIAASGPTALATSFAPWAKLSIAAAPINGRVNSELTDCLSLLNLSAALWIIGFTMKYKAIAIARPRPTAVRKSSLIIFFKPFKAR